MSQKVVILDYGAGNIFSVTTALQRLGINPLFTSDITQILSSDKVIIPGVGEASTAMNMLKSKGLDVVIPQLQMPVLGICLGLQIMCEFSEEGNTHCLGIFPNRVIKFNNNKSLENKIPQMGWNKIFRLRSDLFKGIPDGEYMYFVHSYFANHNEYSIALTDYIQPFASALHKDNFFATQFHPEKSGEIGERILKNFLSIGS
jgi:glutamine amidotransferase